MKFPRAGFTVLFIAGIGALAVFGLLVNQWWNNWPSDDAKRLTELYERRVPLPDTENAWIDLYGFAAPEGEDPREVGARRIAWMARSRDNPDREKAGKDPGESKINFAAMRSPEMRRIFEACIRRSGRACGEAMKLNTDGVTLSSLESLLKPRYLALQRRGGMYATVDYDPAQPLADFPAVLEAQRLTLLRLQGAARRGDVEAVREALQTDLAFWRRMLVTSDILIDRMIVIAALRQHFVYGNFVLRELPADRAMAAVPPAWLAPVTGQERSMWPVAASEYRFTVRISTMPAYQQDFVMDEEFMDTFDRLMARMPKLRSTQSELNDLAAVYCQVAEAFSVPLDQYLAVHRRLEKGKEQPWLGQSIGRYALRHGSVEGIRRVALVTAQLRARSVPAAEVAQALTDAELRNPYDGKPFTWSATENAVVFDPPEGRDYLLAFYY